MPEGFDSYQKSNSALIVEANLVERALYAGGAFTGNVGNEGTKEDGIVHGWCKPHTMINCLGPLQICGSLVGSYFYIHFF